MIPSQRTAAGAGTYHRPMSGPDTSIDRSPGLSRPLAAADGGMVRLRVPGGRLSTSVLRRLSTLSIEHGDGLVQLTSHGNIQLRTLRLREDGTVPERLADALVATGLVPPSHEQARSIICSPLTSAGHPDLHPLVAELDEAIQAEPELADLPGTFLWALDNGIGDIAAGRWDLCYQAIDATTGLLATDTGVVREVGVREAAPLLRQLAVEFARMRRNEVRPPSHPYQLGLRHRTDYGAHLPSRWARPTTRTLHLGRRPRVGTVGADLLAGVPLGLLAPEMVLALPMAGEVTLTPWRQVLVPGGASHSEELRAAGWVVDPADPWAHVTACIGASGCRRTICDTMAMAERLVEAAHAGEVSLLEDVHLSGCELHCGAPGSDHLEVIAPRHLFEIIDAIDERLEED